MLVEQRFIGSYEPAHFLFIYNKHESRHAGDSETFSNVFQNLDVYFDEMNIGVFLVFAQSLNVRGDLLTRATPSGIEIDTNPNMRLDDIFKLICGNHGLDCHTLFN